MILFHAAILSGKDQDRKAMGLLKLSDHLVQNRQTAEQMMHWNKLTKKIQIWWLCLTCPRASLALQFGDFVPRDCSAANGPLADSQWMGTVLCNNQ